ncbi:hypothetical protein DAPPUDRAFT_327489 [Daphnia pulex]|uniref:snRNA-activating protein complex subunit 3 n=1 Tax=Daphnia pulex TaxID=6669 RepID=E9HAW3_DAPPU|nr:hypothetical protein DAPPUDRAFT_327489 [Daphnia pulex]|eukprot:EFX71149.1 hypothetical protein DAPPUDRAFT_327489 [Daphnia pulex]
MDPSPVFKLLDNHVVIARVFRPFESNLGSNIVPHMQDFMLLGSQNLVDFRDQIICLNDEVMVTDDSNPRNLSTGRPIKDLLNASMFFIGNTFYSDFRDYTNIDYGDLIEKWAKDNPEKNLGPFEKKKMEYTTIADLEIRLGYPYVFVHLGSCEHLITFVDARLMVPDDLQNVDEYPLAVETDTNLLMYCGVCDVHDTSYYVDDEQLPSKPMNLCEQCLKTFYKKNDLLPPSTDDVFYKRLPPKKPFEVNVLEDMEDQE